MGSDLHGKVAVVTGGAMGMGAEVARRFVAEGARVVVADIDDVAAKALAASLGENALALAHDVSEESSWASVVEGTIGAFGGIDILINNAGIWRTAPLVEQSVEGFDQILAVNLRGVFLCCQAFGRPMLERGAGRIVAVSSMSGNHIVNRPQRQCAYNASKAGVTALVKSLAAEWGPRGVRVNAVSPGYVDTPLLASKADLHEGWKDGTVLRRFAEPAEIAGAIGYLLGDEAGFCCGTELLIDGGYSLW
jgi:NAD(P)-dependent dehydrogenase (short-subunit alcohol dehydrogenase family)